MSVDEQNIQAFVELIESQPSLFSVEDQANLWQLISTLPNDAEQISNALDEVLAVGIADWCNSREKIYNALLPLIGELSQTRSPAKVFKSPDPKDYNDILYNAMRVSFPSVTSQQPNTQPPSNQKPSNSQP